MAALEADAKERSERRKLREKEAQVIKEMGNQAFKENNFEKALEYYNQVLSVCLCLCVCLLMFVMYRGWRERITRYSVCVCVLSLIHI